jgi:hypothetical protein
MITYRLVRPIANQCALHFPGWKIKHIITYLENASLRMKKNTNHLPGVKRITAFMQPHSLPSGDSWRNLPMISWELNSGFDKKSVLKNAYVFVWRATIQGTTCKEIRHLPIMLEFNFTINQIMTTSFGLMNSCVMWFNSESQKRK